MMQPVTMSRNNLLFKLYALYRWPNWRYNDLSYTEMLNVIVDREPDVFNDICNFAKALIAPISAILFNFVVIAALLILVPFIKFGTFFIGLSIFVGLFAAMCLLVAVITLGSIYTIEMFSDERFIVNKMYTAFKNKVCFKLEVKD